MTNLSPTFNFNICILLVNTLTNIICTSLFTSSCNWMQLTWMFVSLSLMVAPNIFLLNSFVHSYHAIHLEHINEHNSNEVTICHQWTIHTKFETRRTAVSSLHCWLLSCCNAEINPVHWFGGMSVTALSVTVPIGNMIGTGSTAQEENRNM